MARTQQEDNADVVISPHRRRGRIAIKVGLGFFWLLGISVGISVLFGLVVLATQNPLTFNFIVAAGATGIGLPSIFLCFSHVRSWFLGSLERAAKWFIPDPKSVEKPGTEEKPGIEEKPGTESPGSSASSSSHSDVEKYPHDEVSSQISYQQAMQSAYDVQPPVVLGFSADSKVQAPRPADPKVQASPPTPGQDPKLSKSSSPRFRTTFV